MKRNEDGEGRERELQAAMEGVVAGITAEVRAWQATHPRATFTELEEMVQQARKKYGEALMEALIAEREEVRPEGRPRCPECGAEMRYKGQKRRRVVSSIGETDIERGYYYCPQCKRGVFPPG